MNIIKLSEEGMKVKKMTRFMAMALATVFLMGAVLTGCGAQQQETPAATDQGTATATEPAATEQPKENVTLNYTYWGGPFEKPTMEKLIAAFEEKYPYIKVQGQHIPADYEAKMSAMVAGNEAPDLGYIRDFMALDFAKQGMLYNIFDLIDKDGTISRDDFIENLFLYWDKDKSYGMYTATEAYGLFYNKEAFKEAGIDGLPTSMDKALTWDQLVEIARKLTIDQNGKNATEPGFDSTKIKQYGIRFDFNQGAYMPLVQSNGGDYVTDDNQFGLAQPKALEVIQNLSDLITKYHVAPSPAEAKSLPSTAVSLTTRQAAIIMIGQWVLLDLAESGVDYGVGVLPNMGQYVTSPGWGTIGIFKSSQHPEEAYLFWKWLCSTENSMDAHKAGLWMPLMKKYYTDENLIKEWATGNPAHPEGYVDAIMKPALTNLKQHPSSYVKNFPKIDALVQPALERIYMGQETAEQAMKKIEPEVSKLIEGKYTK
jgi:multiple sugar transport system substrate-binding protein